MDSIASILESDNLLSIADIGASSFGIGDVAPLYQGLIDAGKARLIAFEPDEAAFKLLCEKYPPPNICSPLFIGNGKPGTYFETNKGPTGSLFEPNTSLVEKFPNLANLMQVVNTWPIQTTRLDDIPEIDDVDFIKIDVQGAELMIFENAPRTLSGVSLIQTEVSFMELYKGMPLFGDIDRCLRSMGFQWHTRLGCGYRPFLPILNPEHHHMGFNQEIWGDVVYVKDWMKFDQLPAKKLIKLAVLLHDLYNSYDLAHLAMAAADAQLGTNYAANYAKWLSE